MYSALLALLVLPLLALAQTTSSRATASASANAATTTAAPSGNATAAAVPQNTTVVFTSITTSVGFGPGRVETTLVSTRLITSVMPVATANSSANSTTAATTTSPTSTVILPTAATSIDGGGVGGAPSPGANSPNGAFGPNDGYIAAATTLAKKALAVSLVASLVGGALIVV